MIVFKVEYDEGGGIKSRGARFGPIMIQRAFKSVPWRVAEDGSLHSKVWWQGDIGPIVSLPQYKMRMESLFTNGLTPFISLSGDNFCAFETVYMVAQHTKNIALAVLDAHPDACDMDHDPHAHWVRKLWQEGIVAPEKTVFFGIRDSEEQEMRFIKEKKAIVIASDEVDYFLSTGLNRAGDWPAHRWRNIPDYMLVIIVDIDVLDPAYAPGTGILRAGGLNVRRVLNIIRRLCALPFAMKIGEICEVIPAAGDRLRKSDKRPDPCGLTVLAAEAIFREMLQSLQPQT